MTLANSTLMLLKAVYVIQNQTHISDKELKCFGSLLDLVKTVLVQLVLKPNFKKKTPFNNKEFAKAQGFITQLVKGSFIQYVRTILRNTNIFYSLINTSTCAYQKVRDVSFSENFANLLNE